MRTKTAAPVAPTRVRAKSAVVRSIKAGEDDGMAVGEFEAIVSVFDYKDFHGDIVRKGAFTESLKAWKDSGDPIPIYWSHRLDDPHMNIGAVLDAKETDEGLWIKGQLDMDEDAKNARQVYRLMKGRRVKQFSYTYDILDGGWQTEKEDGEENEYFELRKLDIHEVGPTPLGANDQTDLLDVKHAKPSQRGEKVGRTLSAKNETALREVAESLESAAKGIKSVLASVAEEAEADEDDKADDEGTEETEGTEEAEKSRDDLPDPDALLLDLELSEWETVDLT